MSSWKIQMIHEWRGVEVDPWAVVSNPAVRKLADARRSRGLCPWCGEPDPRRRGFCGCKEAQRRFEELALGRIS